MNILNTSNSNRCTNCLGKHHLDHCTSQRTCFKCQQLHNSTLCPLNKTFKNENEYKVNETSKQSTSSGTSYVTPRVFVVTAPDTESSDNQTVNMCINEKLNCYENVEFRENTFIIIIRIHLQRQKQEKYGWVFSLFNYITPSLIN